jgi:hypothetical protein
MMNKRKAVAIAIAREQQIARSMEILFAGTILAVIASLLII